VELVALLALLAMTVLRRQCPGAWVMYSHRLAMAVSYPVVAPQMQYLATVAAVRGVPPALERGRPGNLLGRSEQPVVAVVLAGLHPM
jgi:uncharacterized membrane protein